MGWPTQQAVFLVLTLGITNIKPMKTWSPPIEELVTLQPGKLGGVTGLLGRPGSRSRDSLPFTTSETLQLGSMLPMCLGWAGLVLPSKIRAAAGRRVLLAGPQSLPCSPSSPGLSPLRLYFCCPFPILLPSLL